MSEGKKLLIGFAVVSGICLCMAIVAFFGLRQFGQQVDNMVSGDPTAVAQAQENIADFDIPPGYRSMTMSMFIYDMITLMPEDNRPMIMLMQYSGMTSNREQMERELRQAVQQQSPQPGISMQVVDEFETTIRGKTVIISISEGNAQNLVMRQWIAVFEGNNGLVVFMAQGVADAWDDELLLDFLASIR